MYREMPPPAGLESYVACVWTRSGPGGPVLPDGCVDVVWTGADLVVAGPATQVLHPRVEPEATKLGVRFRMGTAGAALGMPVDQLLDLNVLLSEVWRGPLEPPRDLAGLVRTVARKLPAPELDPLVRAAALETARFGPGVAELARSLGLGERQLLRRFRRAVGYGPRTLARVVRFQRFLALAEADPRADLAWLAAAAGYADQPHLTRECRRLSGRTPRELIEAGAGAAGERSESFNTAPARSAILAA